MNTKELNAKEMEKVAGGTGEKWRTEIGVVTGTSDIGSNNYNVATENCGTVLAHYDAIHVVQPGMKVKVALVGMGKWQIAEFL